MKLGIYTTLTKKYILDRITQEEIMEKYLGISVVLDVLICAPPIIRQDTNPTCSFYYNQHGRLRFRDFSGYFWGDCFDVVAKAIGVDSSTPKGFQMILHTIAKDFRIHKYTDSKEVAKYNKITYDFFIKKKIKKKKIFKIIPRRYNYHDMAYWSKRNINETLLYAGKVYPAQEIYISSDGIDFSLLYTYSVKDPAYCYYGGRDKNGIEDWKIYYPLRDKPRFHSNSSFVQGKHLITCGRVGIITKSFKDVLCFRSYGLQAIAPPAESVLISKDDYFFMKSNFDFIVSCMDFDRAGCRMAQQLRKVYGITPIMLTTGLYNSFDYGSKDFSDYRVKNGHEKTLELLTSVFNKYTFTFQELDKYYYNVLKHIA